MDTFTWCPKIEPEGTISQRTLSVSFGDGYSQTAGDGINTKTQSWALTFTGKQSMINEIITFLDAHSGWQAFYWSAPLSEQATFMAKDGYQITPHGGGLYTLTVTFTQVYR